MADKSDKETVDEETQVEQTSAASLAWVLDTCAEAVVELTDAEDFADACISSGPAHHARLMTGGATRLLLRANRSLVITHAGRLRVPPRHRGVHQPEVLQAQAPAARGAGREGRRAGPGGGGVLALRDPAHHLS